LPLVLINGLGAPNFLASLYGLVFRARGMRVFTAPQSFLNYGDIRESARLVGETVEHAITETGSPKVNLVGVSLGGLIGLYYVKCAGGAPYVDRFVSVGGPLNGSPVACVGRVPPLTLVKSLGQTCSESDIVREVHEAPNPEGVRLYAMGTRGDPITPRASWAGEGLEVVETPHGFFPLGHYCLYFLPGNHRVVLDLLRAG
jgi:pimeloyl-ACP methyl ester carboxylesterase